jgi:hypothetical protein
MVHTKWIGAKFGGKIKTQKIHPYLTNIDLQTKIFFACENLIESYALI